MCFWHLCSAYSHGLNPGWRVCFVCSPAFPWALVLGHDATLECIAYCRPLTWANLFSRLGVREAEQQVLGYRCAVLTLSASALLLGKGRANGRRVSHMGISRYMLTKLSNNRQLGQTENLYKLICLQIMLYIFAWLKKQEKEKEKGKVLIMPFSSKYTCIQTKTYLRPLFINYPFLMIPLHRELQIK